MRTSLFSKWCSALIIGGLVLAGFSLGGCVVVPAYEQGYVTTAPPPPRQEVIVQAPGPAYVWLPGFWAWHGRWVWSSGHWARRPHSNAVWVRGHWRSHRRGYRWTPGHWR